MRAKKPAGSEDVSGALGPVSDVTSASVMGAGDAEADGALETDCRKSESQSGRYNGRTPDPTSHRPAPQTSKSRTSSSAT